MRLRLILVVIAGLLSAAALPVPPAAASAAATAVLVSDTDLFPGPGQVVRLRVTNTEPAVTGRTINLFSVLVPTHAGLTLPAAGEVSAPGFQASRLIAGPDLHQVSFRNGALLPGESVEARFAVDVAAPFRSDRLADFGVAISSNGGVTQAGPAQKPVLTVRALEVLPRGVRPVAPALPDGSGVLDRTGTAGQQITYQVDVRSHAREPLQVTVDLASPAGDRGTPAAVTVPGQGSASAQVPVQLGAAGEQDLDRLSELAVSVSSAAAKARPATDGFTVQPAARLLQAGAALSPSAARTAPSATGQAQPAVAFTIALDKQGAQSLKVEQAELVLTPQGGGSPLAPARLAAPVAVPAGNQRAVLTFTELALPAGVTDGRYDATVTVTATDTNAFTTREQVSLPGAFEVDNTGPVVAARVGLPADRDGDATTAARSYSAADDNAITVTVTSEAGSTPQEVELQCDGSEQRFSPVSPPVVRQQPSEVQVTAVFRPQLAPECGAVRGFARLTDRLGNTGQGTSATPTAVDNTVPSFGRGRAAVVREPRVDPDRPVLLVRVDDAPRSGSAVAAGVIGGCDPAAYTVDGQPAVAAVWAQTADGSLAECTTGARARAAARPASNERYLTFARAITRTDATSAPAVTYDPARSSAAPDRLKDAAGNYAPAGRLASSNRLAPAPLPADRAARGAGSEQVAARAGTFHTRFAGPDLLLHVAPEVPGDRLQLLENDVVVAQQTLNAPSAVPVPVDDDPGRLQAFAVRLLSPAGVPGPATAFAALLDQTAPAVATVTATPEGAQVTFSEPVVTVDGADDAADWTGVYTPLVQSVPSQPSQETAAALVRRTQDELRQLVLLPPAGTTLTQVRYRETGGDADRYRDYAGNPLTDITAPVR